MAKNKEVKELIEKLTEEKSVAHHWRVRALVAEKQVEKHANDYGRLNQAYYAVYKELQETKSLLPKGNTLTHINNLVSMNESLRRHLTGDNIGISRRLRLFWKLLFKR